MKIRPATVEDLDSDVIFVYNDSNYHTEVEVEINDNKGEVTIRGYNAYKRAFILEVVPKRDVYKHLLIKEY